MIFLEISRAGWPAKILFRKMTQQSLNYLEILFDELIFTNK